MFDFEKTKSLALKVIARLCRKKPEGVPKDEIVQGCREEAADKALSECALVYFQQFEWTVEEDGLIRLTELGMEELKKRDD